MHLVFFNKKLSLFMKIVDVSVFILSLVLIVICFGQNLINIISRSYRVWLQKQSLIGTWMEHNPCSPISMKRVTRSHLPMEPEMHGRVEPENVVMDITSRKFPITGIIPRNRQQRGEAGRSRCQTRDWRGRGSGTESTAGEGISILLTQVVCH